MKFNSYYYYRGAVMMYGKVIMTDWSGSTVATSEESARRCLMQQFREMVRMSRDVALYLPDRLVVKRCNNFMC